LRRNFFNGHLLADDNKSALKKVSKPHIPPQFRGREERILTSYPRVPTAGVRMWFVDDPEYVDLKANERARNDLNSPN
jgi:hypothetical protein